MVCLYISTHVSIYNDIGRIVMVRKNEVIYVLLTLVILVFISIFDGFIPKEKYFHREDISSQIDIEYSSEHEFISPNSRGETIIVDDDGGQDYQSIQAAVDAAIPGDTIMVYAGDYNEDHLQINKTLTLI